MLLSSCVDKKKKRKLSTLEEGSSSMWSDSRGTPLPSGGVAVSSSRSQPPQAAALEPCAVTDARYCYSSLSLFYNKWKHEYRYQQRRRMRTPQNWGNDQPMLLPSVDTAKHNIRQQPTLAPPPKPDSFGIVIVADLDKKSKDENSKKPQFLSYIMHATLKVTPSSSSATQKRNAYSVTFGEETKFSTSMNEAGRGFELSELAWFNGKLLAFDDRTGIVFRLKHFEGVSRTKPLQAIPEHIIMEGDGFNGKGQKHEWATVKDGELYMGSVGNVIGDGNLWVAVMDRAGDVRHEDWTANFAAVRKALGCDWPGYVTEPYNDMEDEKRGSNKVIIASEDFSSIQVREVGKVTPLRGFSSFKFVPRSDDSVIVAIKSVEVEDEQRQTSYITVFDVDGNVLMDETEIPGAKKYEGVAFAHDWS
ncbi:Apyrase [Phytophthora cactorum]|nr:Apyrase [Phytophthora cactorum]